MVEIKTMMRDGFAEARERHAEHGKRIKALEDFRTRAEERDRALAKAEGNLTIRLPMLALLITTIGIVVGVIVALASHAG